MCRWAVKSKGSKCLIISDLLMTSGLSPLVENYQIQIMLALQRTMTTDETDMATHIWHWPTFLDVHAPPPPSGPLPPGPPHQLLKQTFKFQGAAKK